MEVIWKNLVIEPYNALWQTDKQSNNITVKRFIFKNIYFLILELI